MQTIAQKLKIKIERFACRLRKSHPLLKTAESGRVDPVSVTKYLACVRALLQSTPLHLELARRRAEELGDQPLARFLEKKIREEAGHARWAERDLSVMRDQFGQIAPAPLESMRKLIRHLERVAAEQPARYLGYILFAEYFTVLAGPQWISALVDHCSIPPEALTAITRHIELDKEHVAEALLELNDLLQPQPEAETTAILGSLEESMQRFKEFLDELHAFNVRVSSGPAPDVGASWRPAELTAT